MTDYLSFRKRLVFLSRPGRGPQPVRITPWHASPDQLAFETSDPPSAELMMDKETLTAELNGLDFLHLRERTRETHEGQLHNGRGAVVQPVGWTIQVPAR